MTSKRINLKDVQPVQNLANKIQYCLNKDKSYLFKDQEKLQNMLISFHQKYNFLTVYDMFMLFRIPTIVMKRIRVDQEVITSVIEHHKRFDHLERMKSSSPWITKV